MLRIRVKSNLTADSDKVRLVKIQDNGLNIALGGCQSRETMKCDIMSHCTTLVIDVPQKQCANHSLESLLIALHWNRQ
jgi:hypothetical protein